MVGFIIAATLVILRLALDVTPTESDIFTAIINASSFLFWWYLVTGVVSLTLAFFSWAGDLGSEGARMRVGIASPVAWMIGLNRIPICNLWPIIYLTLRRALLVGGAYLLMLAIQSGGMSAAGLASQRMLLAVGTVLLVAGLMAGFIKPRFRREYPDVRMREFSSS